MKHLWRAYLYRLLRSPLTWISLAMTTVVAYFHVIYEPFASKDTVAAYELLLSLDAFRKIIPLIVSLPFASQFAREWNSRIFDFIIARSGFRSYVRTQVCVCTLSSFLVCFIGLMLYIGICCITKPLYLHDANRIIPPYGILLENGHPILYLMIMVCIFSASCALWSICGMVMSAIFPNVYVAFCCPFICSYLVERLTDTAPVWFRFETASLGFGMLSDRGAVFNFLYNIGFFLIWIMLLAFVFQYIIGRRVRCELR